jgi:hypothetical protein
MRVAPSSPGRAPSGTKADRFTRIGVVATILIALATSAAGLIDHGLDLNVPVLDSASDGGVFGALVDVAVGAAAASAWLVVARARSARSVATVLAVLLTFLAVDQVSGLHNHVPHWLAFYLPLLLASFVCLVAIARGLPGLPRVRTGQGAADAVVERLVGVGLVVLVFSFFLHLFGERLLAGLDVASPAGWAYQVKAVVKHGTEAAGWLLIALGLLRLGLPSRFRFARHDGRRAMARATAPRLPG